MPPKLQSTRDAAQAPKPVVRAQNDDTAPTIRIPTPDELGIGGAKVLDGDEPLDWVVVDRQLDAAGATGYQVEKTSSGYQFTCRLPGGAVTGRGASRPAAVRHALAQLAR